MIEFASDSSGWIKSCVEVHVDNKPFGIIDAGGFGVVDKCSFLLRVNPIELRRIADMTEEVQRKGP